MSARESRSTARHPGPGCCSNCLRVLPRTTAGSTKFVKFRRPDTSQVKYLRIGDALSYVFKTKGGQTPEIEDLAFCKKCHSLFASLLEAYAGFRAESHAESVVVDFLEGIKVYTSSGSGTLEGDDDDNTFLAPVVVKVESLLLSEQRIEDHEFAGKADEIGDPETDPLNTEELSTGTVLQKRKSAIEAKRFLKSYNADEVEEDVDTNSENDYDPRDRVSSDENDEQESADDCIQHDIPIRVISTKRRKPNLSKSSNINMSFMPVPANPNDVRNSIIEKPFGLMVQRLSSVQTRDVKPTSKDGEIGNIETEPYTGEEISTGRVLRKRKSTIDDKRSVKKTYTWNEDDDDSEANSEDDYSTESEDSSMSWDTIFVEETEDECHEQIDPTRVISGLPTKLNRKTKSAKIKNPIQPHSDNPKKGINFVLDKTYSSEAEALAQIEFEVTWNVSWSYESNDKKFRKRYYRCNQVPYRAKRNDRCAKRLYLLYREGSSEVSLYRCGQAHTNHSDTVKAIKPQSIAMSPAEAEEEFYTDEHGVVSVKCFECSTTFGGVMDWAEHQRSIHNTNLGWRSRSKDLASIKQNVTPLKGRYLPCPAIGCSKILFARVLRGHVQKVHKNNPCFKCSECGKGFTSGLSLQAHLKAQHPADPVSKTANLCRHCGKTFSTAVYLERHEKVHLGELERPHLCSQCGKAFAEKQTLERHLLTHLPSDQQPKPFKCPICPAAFRTKTSLIRHEVVHSEQRDLFKCTHCDRAYPRKASLFAHYLSVHKISADVARGSLNMKSMISVLKEPSPSSLPAIQVGRKPGLTCGLCSKKYTRREYLTSHLIGIHGKTEGEAKGMTGLETKRTGIVPKSTRKERRRKADSDNKRS